MLFKSRKNLRIPGRDQSDDAPEVDHVCWISSQSSVDAKLWPKFRSMVEETGLVPRIVKTDWLLDLALAQEIRWDDAYEITGHESN